MVALTFHGAPRTKKNHGRLVRAKGRQMLLPSVAYTAWEKQSLSVLRLLMQNARPYTHLRAGDPSQRIFADLDVRCQDALPLARPVNCRALFYRDAERGDAVGYYQGLADLLQKAKVVTDDKFIVTWDGSRLLKDAARPRVELVLSW